MAVALTTGSSQNVNVPTQTPVMPATDAYCLVAAQPTEAMYANGAGALDQPNKIRIAIQDIPDIFKNSGVTPDSGQRTSGVSILAQVIETWKVDDAANTSFDSYYLPASAHLVLKLPKDAMVTSSVAAAFVLRMLGALWGASADTLAQALAPLMQGATRVHG